jgi:hypothetical protein
MLLALASAIIPVFESQGTQEHNLLSQIRDFTNLEVQVPLYTFSGTGWPLTDWVAPDGTLITLFSLTK